MADEPLVRPTVVATLPEEEAHLLAGRLREAGIAVALDPPTTESFPGYPYGGVRQRVRVLVPEERADAARELMDRIGDG